MLARFMDWPLVESLKSWHAWRDMQRELAAEQRPDGCKFEEPMTYSSQCGTYMHCKTEQGPWRRRE